MVKIVFYTSKPQRFSADIARYLSWSFLQSIDLITVNENKRLISTIAGLKKEKIIIVLVALSISELEELICLKQEFNSLPKILILPDNSVDTLQKGMLLSPVYFMSVQDDFRHVATSIMNLRNMYIMHHEEQNYCVPQLDNLSTKKAKRRNVSL